MLYIIAGLIALCAYLLGSINTSIILSKTFFGQDIRTSGSGNAGATNMLRTHGKKMAVATLIGDVLKGVIAVLIAVFVDKAIISAIDTAKEPVKKAAEPEKKSIFGKKKEKDSVEK